MRRTSSRRPSERPACQGLAAGEGGAAEAGGDKDRARRHRLGPRTLPAGGAPPPAVARPGELASHSASR